MVGIIKREYDEAEKPAAAPLTPDSTPGKSGSKRLGDEASSEDSSPAPAPAPSKKRVKQNKNFSARSKRSTIPTCYEETSESDRLLLKLKDENKSWKEIWQAMEKLTGEKLLQSSLMPRYSRLKANLTVMPKQDQDQLLSSKEIVETRIERERWNMIAEEMRKHGSGSYTGAAVEKQFKKMMKPDKSNIKN